MARPRRTVRADDGQEVYGLSYTRDRRADKDCYYITMSKPRRWLGYDRDEAIQRFYSIKARETQEHVAVGRGSEIIERLVDGAKSGALKPGLITHAFMETFHEDGGKFIDADHFYNRMRDALRRDPKGCAKRTGIKELGYLGAIERPKPSVTVARCLAIYTDERTRQVSANERGNLAYAWKVFREAVDVTVMEDVHEEHIEAWEKALIAKGWADMTVRNQIARVKCIVRYCAKRHPDCARVLKLVDVVEPPPAPPFEPKPMPVGDYRKLLDAADDRWKAILLVSMNACYYGVDCWTLPKSAVSETDIVFRRAKTKVSRVAWLWPRTRDALAKLPNHAAETVFVADHRGPYKPGGFRSAYRRLRERAGVESTFDMIRDGAYTAAVCGAPLEEAKLVAGHARGTSDHYVLRGGEMVREACEAIESHYF